MINCLNNAAHCACLIRKHICSSTAGKFLIEGDFYCQIITYVILTIKTFFLKISVNIILIQMPFPATPKTSLTVFRSYQMNTDHDMPFFTSPEFIHAFKYKVYCHTSKKICPICFQSNAYASFSSIDIKQ